jgi:hypothetical protein
MNNTVFYIIMMLVSSMGIFFAALSLVAGGPILLFGTLLLLNSACLGYWISRMLS